MANSQDGLLVLNFLKSMSIYKADQIYGFINKERCEFIALEPPLFTLELQQCTNDTRHPNAQGPNHLEPQFLPKTENEHHCRVNTIVREQCLQHSSQERQPHAHKHAQPFCRCCSCSTAIDAPLTAHVGLAARLLVLIWNKPLISPTDLWIGRKSKFYVQSD